MSSVFSVLFLIDIVLNFRTGIVRAQSDSIILDPTLIARWKLITYLQFVKKHTPAHLYSAGII